MQICRCFLLSSLKYGDEDAIIHCFAEDLGYQSFFVKKIYAARSKKKAYLFPLNELELTILPMKAGKITNVSRIEWTKNSFNDQDQKINSIRMFSAEFLNQVLRNENDNANIYSILLKFNHLLQQNDYNAHLYLVFEILRGNGLLPLFSEAPFLNPESGTFEDYQNHPLFDESISEIWKIHHLSKGEENNTSLLPSRKQRNAFLESMMVYYKIHFSGFHTPGSLEILKQVYE